MDFIKHFYIIFGTNLLTQSPVPVSVFSLFLSIAEKENQTESNWSETSRNLFLERKQPRRLGVYVREATRKARGRGRAHLPQVRPPPSWAPRCSTDVLLPPIYTYVPPKPTEASTKT